MPTVLATLPEKEMVERFLTSRNYNYQVSFVATGQYIIVVEWTVFPHTNSASFELSSDGVMNRAGLRFRTSRIRFGCFRPFTWIPSLHRPFRQFSKIRVIHLYPPAVGKEITQCV